MKDISATKQVSKTPMKKGVKLHEEEKGDIHPIEHDLKKAKNHAERERSKSEEKTHAHK
jgi:hypothetical protein